MTFDTTRIRWNGWGPRDEALAEPAWRWLADALGMPALLATPPRALEDIALPPSQLPDAARDAFISIVGKEQVKFSDLARATHAAGRGLIELLKLRAGDLSRVPDAVLCPRYEDDILALLRAAAQHDVAVVPFGGGTSMVGGTAPSRGTHTAVISLDLSAMTRIADVDVVSGLARVEPGITGPELDRQLAARGMTLGHFPDSFEFSTLGGWIAANSVGQDAHAYGRASDWLMGVRLATPSGLITAQGPSAAGPDLRQMVLGSEGTLGVITAATVRIHPLPALEEHRVWLFPDFASGLAATREAVRAGIPHTMLRLSDAAETRLLRALERDGHGFNLRARLTDMYLEAHRFNGNAARLTASFAGTAAEVASARRRFGALARKLGALYLHHDRDWPERRFSFGYRRDLFLDRGVGMDRIESFSSWAKLPLLYAAVRNSLDAAMRRHAPRPGAQGQVLVHLGHARHEGASATFTMVYPRILDGEIAQADAIRRAGIEAILSQGGTISHAFGVGEDYLPWIEREKSTLGLEALRALKAALDPKGIMNPGKLLP